MKMLAAQLERAVSLPEQFQVRYTSDMYSRATRLGGRAATKPPSSAPRAKEHLLSKIALRKRRNEVPRAHNRVWRLEPRCTVFHRFAQ
jgi:hypothetical protein